MAIQFASYDDSNMQPGVFYLVEVDLDNASNLRPITTITVPLDQAIQDIIELRAQQQLHSIDISDLNAHRNDFKTQLDDNTARINNLEDEDLRAKYLEALDLATIRKTFSGATEIEIEYGRRDVISVQVYVLKEQTDQILVYQESSSTVLIEQIVELDQDGNPVVKKILLKSNNPISGYALVL